MLGKKDEAVVPKMTAALISSIEDMPVEVLILIFTALPWLDRVRIERVSPTWRRIALAYAWGDVHHFDETINEFHTCEYAAFAYHSNCYPAEVHITFRSPLLTRFGHHLTSLALWGLDESTERWLYDLAQCPNLKHLSIRSLRLPHAAIHHIRRNYGAALRTLRVAFCYQLWVEEASALSEALRRDLTALECLEIEGFRDCGGHGDEALVEFSLNAPSLQHLRHFTYRRDSRFVLCFTHKNPLPEAYLALLASLPSLKSLTIDDDAHPFSNFAFLQNFLHLEHLAMRVDASNLASFSNTLPHLGRQGLKALEVLQREQSRSFMNELATLIATHLPHLEHLGMHTEHYVDNRMLLTSAPQLEELLSLELRFNLPGDGDWGWLERISEKLEYLALRTTPPYSTICSVIRRCKNLRSMKIGSFRWIGHDRSLPPPPPIMGSDDQILQQLESVDASTLSLEPEEEGPTGTLTFLVPSRGGVEADLAARSPPSFPWDSKSDGSEAKWPKVSVSTRDPVIAHVLHRYKYGEQLSKEARILERSMDSRL